MTGPVASASQLGVGSEMILVLLAIAQPCSVSFLAWRQFAGLSALTALAPAAALALAAALAPARRGLSTAVISPLVHVHHFRPVRLAGFVVDHVRPRLW